MRIVRGVEELRRVVAAGRASGASVGFVPTMGALHEGHLSLVRQSVADCGLTVVSIFVNPAQFGPEMDLDRYPRTLERDRELLELGGADVLFVPDAAAVYPEGFSTWVVVEGVSELLDGASRPGYFRGIATVVLKLFNMVRPDRAYFGRKDLQQSVVVGRMIDDLDLGIELVVLPIVREPDGLAMSSRNAYLSAADRAKATRLHAALETARRAFESGERRAATLVGLARKTLESEPAFAIDYVEMVDARTMRRVEEVRGASCLAIAVDLSGTRLIDNLVLGEE